MARVKGGTVARNRRKKILKDAKGYFGSKHRLFKTAKEQVMHSLTYAYRDRKQNKRNFRKLWITRINAACKEEGLNYSKFINGLNKAGLDINRKMLSELAINDLSAFSNLIKIAKEALEGKEYEPEKVEIKENTMKKIDDNKDNNSLKNKEKISKSETGTKKTIKTKKSTTKKSTIKKTSSKKNDEKITKEEK
jgi:large subunit ribosomal protein L20